MDDNRRILITGGTGLLGCSLIETFPGDHEIVSTYVGNYKVEHTETVRYEKIDIRDHDSYSRLFKSFKPNVVIHTASIGSPDYAENNRQITWEINIGGTEKIVSLCEEHEAKYVYISSNGIYDGNCAPYGESDEAKPVNYYGEIKLAGESIVKGRKIKSAIIRPNILYGWHNPSERSNIVTMAVEKLRRGDTFMGYGDVYVMPLYVEQCAEAIKKIIDENRWETFNIAGRDRVSIFEFIRTAAQVFGLDEAMVKSVGHDYFKGMVPRPRDTSYRTRKMENELKLLPLGIKEGLFKMKETERIWNEKP